MPDYSAFEILGPIMIGPSSSHTAGACKIANTALSICDKDFNSVDFLLHGSFAMTYKGHGTDRALIGGILGYSTYSDELRNSFELAKTQNLKYKIEPVNLGNYHPNTVKIIFHYDNKPDQYIIGSSIGGGNIEIVDINGVSLKFRGEFPTLIFQYNEQKGIISLVSGILSNNNYNIESINTKKDTLNNKVTLTIEINDNLTNDIKNQLMNDHRFLFFKYLRF